MAMKFKCLLFLYLNCTIFSAALSADRIYVNKSAPLGGDGTSWENAFQFIHDALSLTESGRGDEVWIAKGTYYPDEGSGITDNDTAAAFNLTDAVSVYGGFSGVETNIDERNLALNKTIISGSVYTNEDLTSIPSYEALPSYEGLYSSVIFQCERDYTLDGLVIKNTVNIGNSVIGNSNIQALAKISNCDFLYNYFTGNLVGDHMTIGIYRNCNFAFNGVNGFIGLLFNHLSIQATDCVFDNNTFESIGQSEINAFTNCVFANNILGAFCIYGYVNVTNCVFYANFSDQPIFDNGQSTVATNCTISENVSLSDAVINQNSNLSLRNSIIGVNNISASGTLGDSINNLIVPIHNPALTPGPDSSVTRATNLIFNEGYVAGNNDFGSGFVISTDPLFVDTSNVKGPDNIWGTADDGLRLQSTSPAIDVVGNNSLPFDTHDLDQDGDTAEVLSLDIAGNLRNQGNAMDLGAYEFNSSEIASYALLSTAGIGGTVTQSGVSDHLDNSSVTITALPDEGYLFTAWYGDINATENPTTLIMDRNKSVVAVFIQDNSDSDGDGLSNYAEAVTYGSDPNQIDTSGAGLDDKTIVDAGFDPTKNYQGLITSLDYHSLDALKDLRSGAILLSNGPDNLAKLQLQIERTEDLINWTARTEDIFEIEIPLSADKEFYRFAFPQD